MSGIKSEKQLLASGGVLVVEVGDRKIWEFPDKASGMWRSFYLRLPGKKRRGFRRSIHFGFDGERISKNNSTRFLEQRQPEIYSWLVETMENLA